MNDRIPRQRFGRVPFPLALAIITLWCVALTSRGVDASPAGSGSFFKVVREQAQRLAQQPHKKREQVALPESLKNLNYDQYQDIKFKPETAPWAQERLPFALQFLPRGYLYQDGVIVHVIEGGKPRRVQAPTSMFNYAKLSVPESPNLDFAGYRIMYGTRPEEMLEVGSFVGASYFRFIGLKQHYGSSARGLAVDTGESRPEEFPAFTEFWIEKPARKAAEMTFYALLESPSATGAYKFQLRPGPQSSISVLANLFPRAGEKKFGFAPLTSMFLMGENRTRHVPDFRPEVHDCDGLLVADGAKRIWRPIHNPPKKSQISHIVPAQFGGFGLLQRDRSFDSYADLEARYEARPGFWVQPVGNWGKGRVELLEIPTDTEYNDNVAAYWVPEDGVKPGQEVSLQYVISTVEANPPDGNLAPVRATRITPGQDGKPSRVVVDFSLAGSGKAATGNILESVTSSAGEVRSVVTQTNSVLGGWRLAFDMVNVPAGAHVQALLTRETQPITETWIYHQPEF